MSPTVSVVVPVYNGEDCLATACASALAQTLTDLEVVIVDDGSTDSSIASVSAMLADPRLRIIRSEHGGVSRARNVGIAATTAPLVAFLDADDVWHEDKLAVQVAAMRDGTGVCSANAHLISQDTPPGVSIHDISPVPARLQTDPLGALLSAANFVPLSMTVVRREVLDAAGGFDPAMSHAEDLDLWLRIAARGGTFQICPLILGSYHRGAGSASRNLPAIFDGELMAVAKLREAGVDHPGMAARERRARWHRALALRTREASLGPRLATAREVLRERPPARAAASALLYVLAPRHFPRHRESPVTPGEG